MSPTKGIFIVGAKRTPFCKHGGPLRETPASYVFAAAAKDALRTAEINPELVDQTVVGNLHYLSQCDGGKTPRHCGLYSGVPETRPALGVSRGCGTGLQAVITGAVDILSGTSQVCLTGGTEIMSSLPMLVRNVRFGTALGAPYFFEDHVKLDLLDSHINRTAVQMAEEIAKRHNLKREDVDEFALDSHLKWKNAYDNKAFEDEVTTLEVTLKGKDVVVDKDDMPHPELTLEELGRMSPLIEGGVITQGNSSSAADGAAAVLLAAEAVVSRHRLSPLARVAGWAAGTPTRALRALLTTEGLTVLDVDVFEINETSAASALATARQLRVPLRRVNMRGGALAAGHPGAATAAKMVVELTHLLRKRNSRWGVAISNCGGDQTIAILLENVH